MSECSCQFCKNACTHKPGWFLPSDIPKLARHLGITEQELVRDRLAVDYYLLGKPPNYEPIFVLSPANTKAGPGEVYPLESRGRCAFFTSDERCAIHPAKPHECRMFYHTESKRTTHERRVSMVRVWRRHQKWLCDLLGYQPEIPPWSFGDMETVALLE